MRFPSLIVVDLVQFLRVFNVFDEKKKKKPSVTLRTRDKLEQEKTRRRKILITAKLQKCSFNNSKFNYSFDVH